MFFTAILNVRILNPNAPRMQHVLTFTPPKINMEHNHGSLEDHFPF